MRKKTLKLFNYFVPNGTYFNQRVLLFYQYFVPNGTVPVEVEYW